MLNFRFIPFLYDTFKPFLVSHLVLTDKALIFPEYANWYFNVNYSYYGLNVAKLLQSCGCWFALLGLLILSNIIVFALSFRSNRCKRLLTQYRFNAYIRFYMLAYYDFTYFAIMKIVDGSPSNTYNLKLTTIASYVMFCMSIVIPIFLTTVVFMRFPVLKIKRAKQSFNTLVLKLDKSDKWYLLSPPFFFLRRFASSIVLSLPLDNQFVFVQYIVVVAFSQTWAIYLYNVKPYSTPLLNNWMAMLEGMYAVMVMFTLLFSDSETSLVFKILGGAVVCLCVAFQILANLIIVILYLRKGRANIKNESNEGKFKKLEKILMLQ
jgi:hypothetical protein